MIPEYLKVEGNYSPYLSSLRSNLSMPLSKYDDAQNINMQHSAMGRDKNNDNGIENGEYMEHLGKDINTNRSNKINQKDRNNKMANIRNKSKVRVYGSKHNIPAYTHFISNIEPEQKQAENKINARSISQQKDKNLNDNNKLSSTENNSSQSKNQTKVKTDIKKDSHDDLGQVKNEKQKRKVFGARRAISPAFTMVDTSTSLEDVRPAKQPSNTFLSTNLNQFEKQNVVSSIKKSRAKLKVLGSLRKVSARIEQIQAIEQKVWDPKSTDKVEIARKISQREEQCETQKNQPTSKKIESEKHRLQQEQQDYIIENESNNSNKLLKYEQQLNQNVVAQNENNGECSKMLLSVPKINVIEMNEIAKSIQKNVTCVGSIKMIGSIKKLTAKIDIVKEQNKNQLQSHLNESNKENNASKKSILSQPKSINQTIQVKSVQKISPRIDYIWSINQTGNRQQKIGQNQEKRKSTIALSSRKSATAKIDYIEQGSIGPQNFQKYQQNEQLKQSSRKNLSSQIDQKYEQKQITNNIAEIKQVQNESRHEAQQENNNIPNSNLIYLKNNQETENRNQFILEKIPQQNNKEQKLSHALESVNQKQSEQGSEQAKQQKEGEQQICGVQKSSRTSQQRVENQIYLDNNNPSQKLSELIHDQNHRQVSPQQMQDTIEGGAAENVSNQDIESLKKANDQASHQKYMRQIDNNRTNEQAKVAVIDQQSKEQKVENDPQNTSQNKINTTNQKLQLQNQNFPQVAQNKAEITMKYDNDVQVLKQANKNDDKKSSYESNLNSLQETPNENFILEQQSNNLKPQQPPSNQRLNAYQNVQIKAAQDVEQNYVRENKQNSYKYYIQVRNNTIDDSIKPQSEGNEGEKQKDYIQNKQFNKSQRLSAPKTFKNDTEYYEINENGSLKSRILEPRLQQKQKNQKVDSTKLAQKEQYSTKVEYPTKPTFHSDKSTTPKLSKNQVNKPVANENVLKVPQNNILSLHLSQIQKAKQNKIKQKPNTQSKKSKQVEQNYRSSRNINNNAQEKAGLKPLVKISPQYQMQKSKGEIESKSTSKKSIGSQSFQVRIFPVEQKDNKLDGSKRNSLKTLLINGKIPETKQENSSKNVKKISYCKFKEANQRKGQNKENQNQWKPNSNLQNLQVEYEKKYQKRLQAKNEIKIKNNNQRSNENYYFSEPKAKKNENNIDKTKISSKFSPYLVPLYKTLHINSSKSKNNLTQNATQCSFRKNEDSKEEKPNVLLDADTANAQQTINDGKEDVRKEKPEKKKILHMQKLRSEFNRVKIILEQEQNRKQRNEKSPRKLRKTRNYKVAENPDKSEEQNEDEPQRLNSHPYLKAHSHQFSYLYPSTEGGSSQQKLNKKLKQLEQKLRRTNYSIGKRRQAQVHEYITQARKQIQDSQKYLSELEAANK